MEAVFQKKNSDLAELKRCLRSAERVVHYDWFLYLGRGLLYFQALFFSFFFHQMEGKEECSEAA